MTALSVNLNKIATLRNARGGSIPSVIDAARVCIEAGCQGITVHPRSDQRHIRPCDVYALATLLKNYPHIEFNLEGNPWSGPAANGYPGFMHLVESVRPHQCTLVPDSENQLTSDHGFDFQKDATKLYPVITQLKNWKCRVSLFTDAGAPHLDKARILGADRLEIYTGPFAQAYAEGHATAALAACRETAEHAQSLGLGINAGHDLDLHNLRPFLDFVPNVLEVSIGHALISEALYQGLSRTVKSYLTCMSPETPDERLSL